MLPIGASEVAGTVKSDFYPILDGSRALALVGCGAAPREENLRFFHENDRVFMQFSQAYSEKAESHKLLLSRLL